MSHIKYRETFLEDIKLVKIIFHETLCFSLHTYFSIGRFCTNPYCKTSII